MRDTIAGYKGCSFLEVFACQWHRVFKFSSGMPTESTCLDLFAQCVEAIRSGQLISRASQKDKEFHFQNWFAARLEALNLNFEPGGRNSYPDFRIVKVTEGYEIKGLAYPGRYANYDCNSQVPGGFHNGRMIFYVFGRYPANPDGNEYPVVDLVICHGDFLNANHEYKHKNRSVKGFGSYGDIMIRDRKMYVAPTPFGLTEGTNGKQTLILPQGMQADNRFEPVGNLVRTETGKIVIGYTFDLVENTISGKFMDNPDAGKQHKFTAYRIKGTATGEVKMVSPKIVLETLDLEGETDD